MFDQLVREAGAVRGAGAVGVWARTENAACARRLSAIADLLEAALAAAGSADREQWVIDTWDQVAAQVAADQNTSLGTASHQLVIAQALRERLPQVAAVFAQGEIGLAVVTAIVYRTGLILDRDAQRRVDAQIAGSVRGWGPLSVAKTEKEIDFWVDRVDPGALRRTEHKARDRHVDVCDPADGSGLAYVEALLYAQDAAVLDARIEAIAATVCSKDPRTAEQRRGDALGALGHFVDRLVCGCGDPECVAAEATASAVVVYVVANQDSLADDTPVRLDGAEDPGPTRDELLSMTVTEALTDPETRHAEASHPEVSGPELSGPEGSDPEASDPDVGEADASGPDVSGPEVSDPTGSGPVAARAPVSGCGPAAIIGGGLLPAPLLAATLATTAARREYVVHPGDAPPEPRYRPGKALATFVRCRDMTCRFPGCSEPAYVCDLDHTIAYPFGATQASNLACLCRKHHLRKTFCRWRNIQYPDGTVVWTSPGGQTHTTYPGSRLLFPSLCRPTAPVVTAEVPDLEPNCALMMPRRKQTRAQARAKRIEELRRLNDDHIAERNKPPPF